LQGDHDGLPAGRGLVAGEGEGAFDIKLFVFRNGVAVEGDGFGFGEHSVFAILEWEMQSIDLLNSSFVTFCAGESGLTRHW
jgi:hypothetical protein